jgi:hypothetical protein
MPSTASRDGSAIFSSSRALLTWYGSSVMTIDCFAQSPSSIVARARTKAARGPCDTRRECRARR